MVAEHFVPGFPDAAQAMQVTQLLQELRTKLQRLKQRDTELMQQVTALQTTGSAVSAGTGSEAVTAELARSQKELIEALRAKEAIRLVDKLEQKVSLE